ncbi:VOC family protein [Streptomyces sp. NBC_00582]|uniref:VOC family protein n=1 Tax=Streptomyces sp. NBC_00582 TaxID=2975783 RepID=UPI001063A4B8|nr:VOC family protein [Streptomyces sp. NBC_00582]WUB60059.1 VOC family protein [Streptomyces sp. NBC_00582]
MAEDRAEGRALVKAGVVVLDCAEPELLAEFYKGFLDAELTDASANRVEIRSADGTRLAFRRDANATPPSWPRPENSLQVHLDFLVDDLDAAERRIVGLGGRPLDTKGAAGPHEERGYADPAGHSFTLRNTLSTAPKQG